MRIFVSLDSRDRERFEPLKRYLESLGHKVYIAIDHFDPSSGTISDRIMTEIENSDLAYVILTENSVTSQFVQQEIGTIETLEIPLIPIVQPNLPVSGWLYGRDMIFLDLDYPNPFAFSKMNPYLRRVQKSLNFQNLFGIGFLVALAGLILFGKEGIVSNWIRDHRSHSNKDVELLSKTYSNSDIISTPKPEESPRTY